MALNPEHLLNYRIPEVRQRYSREDSAFYALSVGLGADPMDEHQLAFVDANRDIQALPCMAVVLGHPGFWLGNPDTGVDALRLVHGEQEFEFLEPVKPGDTLTTRGEITEAYSKAGMDFITVVAESHNQHGKLAVRGVYTGVVRPA